MVHNIFRSFFWVFRSHLSTFYTFNGYYKFKSYLGGIINPELDFLCNYIGKENIAVAVMEDIIDKYKRNIDCTVKLEKGMDYAFMITAPHSEKVALPFILDISYIGAKPEK